MFRKAEQANQSSDWIQPIWSAPKNIVAATTLNSSGINDSRFGGFNLATHVDDKNADVTANRQRLRQHIALELSIASNQLESCWLDQTHSDSCVQFEPNQEKLQADAIWSSNAHQICAVLTADCLPLLLCSHDGEHIAAVHAGWRGLANGVINHSVRALNEQGVHSKKLMAWLGPAIGPQQFEVGEDVRHIFMNATSYLGSDNGLIDACFSTIDSHLRKKEENSSQAVDESTNKLKNTASSGQKFLADIYQLATLALHHADVHHIYGGGYCTVSDERFYSYRRAKNQNHVTGRMATFIVRN